MENHKIFIILILLNLLRTNRMIREDFKRKKEIISQQNNGMVLLNLWKILEKLLHPVLLRNIKNLLNKMIQNNT